MTLVPLLQVVVVLSSSFDSCVFSIAGAGLEGCTITFQPSACAERTASTRRATETKARNGRRVMGLLVSSLRRGARDRSTTWAPRDRGERRRGSTARNRLREEIAAADRSPRSR